MITRRCGRQRLRETDHAQISLDRSVMLGRKGLPWALLFRFFRHSVVSIWKIFQTSIYRKLMLTDIQMAWGFACVRESLWVLLVVPRARTIGCRWPL